MASMLLALFVSIVLTMLIVRHASTRSRMVDHDLTGPQKFHVVPVPRVGGLGIVAGLIAAVIHQSLVGAPSGSDLGLILMVCAIPAFAFGLAEDLTKQVSARVRLLATAASAVLAFWLLDAQLRHTAIPGLDLIVSFTVGALVVTVFAVAGIANAMNIIDGFNGLASMCAVIMLAGLAYVAFQVGDPLLGTLAVAGIGAVLGFFIWNFPAGLVFLGDGGAYFLGFYIAELSVLLLARNPAVSPMFPLLLCIYPVFETVFSMYRRRFLRQQPPSMPDGIHLHSLIYRRVMRWAVGPKTARAMARRNSMTSPYLWLLCTSSVVPAVLFWRQTAVLVGCLVVFALAYIVLYWRIVRFKSPRWLRFGRSRALWPDATREQEV
ncbi:MAG: glycosyltransferase family 4 protein [Rhodoferax sp.]|jgi:UDP-N-acetylmuramyl pentapeptide phosphotransferase/UDP-N-acetylglucosamine-1-phosphate transferase|nr:glycosyltransferase family 4 protein [Rhodoferax sp.]MCL4738635.1 glycosyltransferase [Burkholderiaceae bacterium]MCP5289742.1 glycosyltransferase family 4 protein [Burkholderiaceae bacterium]